MAHRPNPVRPLPDGRCVWNTLPQEIKDFIFELAYVPDGGCTPMHKCSWQPRICTCSHEHCPIQDHTEGVLATSWDAKVPMERLMVDREWYHAASKVFYSRTNFVLAHNMEYDYDPHFANRHIEGQQMEEFICDDRGLPRSYAKLITIITFVLDYRTISAVMMKIVKMCPSLKHVHLRIAFDYFDIDYMPSDVDDRMWTEQKLEVHDPMLFQLRGISTLTVEKEDRTYSCNCEIFATNLKSLCDLLRATASQPRPLEWSAASVDKRSEHDSESTSTTSTLVSEEPGPNVSTHDHNCPWNRLPQELKDVILEMAYVPQSQVCPLSKASWDEEEEERRERRGIDYEARWFPAKLVDRFLVSREWYQAASTVYYKHANFFFDTPEKMLAFVAKDGTPYAYADRIGKATVHLDARSATQASLITDAAVICSSLRFLQLDIWRTFFNDAEDAEITDPPLNVAYREVWSAADFFHYPYTKSLLSIRGVAQVKITALLSHTTDDHVLCLEESMPKENSEFIRSDNNHLCQSLALFEKILQRAAARARPADQSDQSSQIALKVWADALFLDPLAMYPSTATKPSAVQYLADMTVRDSDIPE
ncbi:hypothetical protein M409DRAFT_23188 [Zasmidium cellare ATCC 36951]|uniref:Uncharacterized protein n=1 Tax=Zasmidium cellare ATCC 36951 TaxID=1080233 RepID=A0A6A6CKT9_ZASCE|nr:uncharacterized protein M409DRAFT_23188 [Zasmidium cellare ATCC 36951]KAF2166552.1 hypothetical protein M409DRAFT_23188 [Zasmidium cellare ATCC 36951]